jgi:hypothetical protein
MHSESATPVSCLTTDPTATILMAILERSTIMQGVMSSWPIALLTARDVAHFLYVS